jgi:TolB protein
LKLLFSLLVIFSVVYGGDATIEIIKKVETLPTIAVEGSSSYDKTLNTKFFKAIVADLNVVSLFNVDRHQQLSEFSSNRVNVANKDMNYVLKYNLYQDDKMKFHVDFKLIQNNKVVLSKKYRVGRQNIYMFISHAFAYDINKYMGAPSIDWIKRKVVFSRVVASKKSEIVVADYTLSYQQVVVKGGFNLFPKWANKKQTQLYYTSLDEFKPTLKHIDIQTAKVKKIISSDGMLVCSDVSEDSKTLLLTMAKTGQPDIYTYNIDTKRYKRLTKYRGIDVNAQFKDKNNIVFISNRLGYPNVFSKNLVTSEVEQVVYYGKSNSACSAHGDYVVYKARESSNAFSKNTFNLHLVSSKTDFIRRLTATGINEFPRFSKDGDAIMFIKNYKSQSAIGIIRLNHNKNYLFPLKYGKLQSIDW